MEEYNLSEGAAVLNSFVWESLGWTQTPFTDSFKVPEDAKIHVPRKHHESEKRMLFYKRSFDPKVQVPNIYPHGALPKAVIVEQLKRKYAKHDYKEILNALDIDSDLLKPTEMYFREKIVKFRQEYNPTSRNQSFLDLSLFDNTDFELRTPKEWMDLGKHGAIWKPVPAVAHLPFKHRTGKEIRFEWQDVAVLKYNPELDTYLVRRVVDCPKGDCHDITLNKLEDWPIGPFDDIWVSRIRLCFKAEDPMNFVSRLASALESRHKVQESLRIAFYIECMPSEGIPPLEERFVREIVTAATSGPSRLREAVWLKHKLPTYISEIRTNYMRTMKILTYRMVTKQKSCFLDEVPAAVTEPSGPRMGYKIPVNYSLEEKMKEFDKSTFLNKREVVQALQLVQRNILLLPEKKVYGLPVSDPLPLDEFIKSQKYYIQLMHSYIHDIWLQAIAKGIKSKLGPCGRGHYNIMQTDWFVYKQAKLKKFNALISFMMQDTIRDVIVDELERYVKIIEEACQNVVDIPDNFVWTDGFNSTKRAPVGVPFFYVTAAVQGVHLEYTTNLSGYRDIIVDLFDDGLNIASDIPHPEKLIMENLTITERRSLDTISATDSQVKAWRKTVETAIDKSIVALQAYAKSYDTALSKIAVDQINYIKKCERQRKSYKELEELIEHHITEKHLMSDTIPSSIDIGPFRVLLEGVKVASVEKHDILAKALLRHFSTKLGAHMEEINKLFGTLQDDIKQPAGNIENLLEQVKWLEQAPEMIEEYSVTIQDLRRDYKTLSSFGCCIGEAEFTAYWNMIGLPYATDLALKQRLAGIEAEKKYLESLLIQDQVDFENTLTELLEEVSRLGIDMLDPDQADLYSIALREMRTRMEDSQKKAETYNMREELFGWPKTQYDDRLTQIWTGFEPYETLWQSASEFLKRMKYEQETGDMGMPLDEFEEILNELYRKFCGCLDFFEGEGMKETIRVLKVRMEEYLARRFGEQESETDAADTSGFN